MRHYYPHHVHLATGSLGDSTLQLADYIHKAKTLGLRSLTLTDHGSLSSMYTFYTACKVNDIAPIIGMEANVVPDYFSSEKEVTHLILLAKNETGLQNLLKIHNDSTIRGDRLQARTDFSTLAKQGKGLIALSGCLAGAVPQALLRGDKILAAKMTAFFKNCFDEFFLELQPGTQDHLAANDGLARLAIETGTPLIVTNNIHYLNADDRVVHKAHVFLRRNETIVPDCLHTNENLYRWFMSRAEIEQTFQYSDYLTPSTVQGALDNTLYVAQSCHCELSSSLCMPQYPVATSQTEDEVLTRMCFDNLKAKLPNLKNPGVYTDRLLYELSVINQLGFCGYFLIVADYIAWARGNRIAVGPGRGSVCGSLVAYLLGISLADPIQYGLPFERFLSPFRKSIPDIDVDFDSEYRDAVFNYAVQKYGTDRCALVSTLGIRKARAALRDAARALQLPYEIADQAAKLIPAIVHTDGERFEDMKLSAFIRTIPALQAHANKYPQLFALASKLETLPSCASIHAAGLIISPVPLADRLPLIRSNKDGIFATSLSHKDVEAAGFVKFDFLSLSSLGVIEQTARDADIVFDFTDEALLNDPAVWSLIGSKDSTGLFQIGSNIYKARMPRLKPTSITELATCLALIRSPCISSGADRKYIEILEGKRQADSIHPLYWQATANTHGILIYQEQLMQIVVNFGFDIETAYTVVKLVAKKKVADLNTFKERFEIKAKKLAIASDVVARIWSVIVEAGQYAFNVAHATSYALLCYQSAYLKHYYPVLYLKNLLTHACKQSQRHLLKEVLNDCQRNGVKFLPLDVNISQWAFTVDHGCIRLGMCAIRGFSHKTAKELFAKRPFVSIADLLARVHPSAFNKTQLNLAIFSGLLDNFSAGSRFALYKKQTLLRNDDPVANVYIGGRDYISVNATRAEMESTILGGQFLTQSVKNFQFM